MRSHKLILLAFIISALCVLSNSAEQDVKSDLGSGSTRGTRRSSYFHPSGNKRRNGKRPVAVNQKGNNSITDPLPNVINKRKDEASPAAPGLNINSVSPIELSLGGLTGLQGLPPLSIIQFIKLLVATMPFMIPLIFVPLLIFTIGIFMIPVAKPSAVFLGDDPVKRSWTSQIHNVLPALKNAILTFAAHEQCFERVVCEIGNRYFGQEDERENSFNYRRIMGSIANRFSHPMLRKLSNGLKMKSDTCSSNRCNIGSLFQTSTEGELDP